MQPADCNLPSQSPWPHRWAVVLACATFPLLWVGGLVTTTDSGMAVPDWPTTFGYNPFFYPLATWLAGPWDIFVEHGHRLLGSLIGMLTIVLVFSLRNQRERPGLFRLGLFALALVVFQGVLGGLRVRLDERTLAMLHGITGPLFFALTIVLAVVTSGVWGRGPRPQIEDRPADGHLHRLAIVTCVLVYLQIVLGAVLRHVPVTAQPATFMLAVKLHLTLAGILTLHVAVLLWWIAVHARQAAPLGRLGLVLGALVVAQLLLGAGSWMVKYYVPSWMPAWLEIERAAILNGGRLQTHMVTAHVAVGSLVLAVSTALALFAWRLRGKNQVVHDLPLGRREALV